MTHTPSISQQLAGANALAEVLDAAYQAFDSMLLTIRLYQDSGGSFYAGLVMAAAAAADGLDAVTDAPSLPSSSTRQKEPLPLNACPSDAAASLAAVSKLVASRLRWGAATADATDDRRACEDGARYADEVHRFASGNVL